MVCASLIISDVPGKVFIGKGENDTVSSFNFSVNQPATTFLIPVYVEIYNESVGAPVSFDFLSCRNVEYILTKFMPCLLLLWLLNYLNYTNILRFES